MQLPRLKFVCGASEEQCDVEYVLFRQSTLTC